MTTHLEKLVATSQSIQCLDFVKVLHYSEFEGEEQLGGEIKKHIGHGNMVVLKGYQLHRGVELKQSDLSNILGLEPSRLAFVHGKSHTVFLLLVYNHPF